ncbi:hypothetical protein BJ508DRAFT_329962 [Ascobolus immersus RN42]|uniref:Uncharacterized protein n=1 Tax=Ascobolus immersus RN42 TaxID=1160509 RepID=A0A3N4I0S1_ASCIM|nr:hypothetical protein BJ508DRAFT_329962 [Ascobolus immersus RN42]
MSERKRPSFFENFRKNIKSKLKFSVRSSSTRHSRTPEAIQVVSSSIPESSLGSAHPSGDSEAYSTMHPVINTPSPTTTTTVSSNYHLTRLPPQNEQGCNHAWYAGDSSGTHSLHCELGRSSDLAGLDRWPYALEVEYEDDELFREHPQFQFITPFAGLGGSEIIPLYSDDMYGESIELDPLDLHRGENDAISLFFRAESSTQYDSYLSSSRFETPPASTIQDMSSGGARTFYTATSTFSESTRADSASGSVRDSVAQLKSTRRNEKCHPATARTYNHVFASDSAFQHNGDVYNNQTTNNGPMGPIQYQNAGYINEVIRGLLHGGSAAAAGSFYMAYVNNLRLGPSVTYTATATVTETVHLARCTEGTQVGLDTDPAIKTSSDATTAEPNSEIASNSITVSHTPSCRTAADSPRTDFFTPTPTRPINLIRMNGGLDCLRKSRVQPENNERGLQVLFLVLVGLQALNVTPPFSSGNLVLFLVPENIMPVLGDHNRYIGSANLKTMPGADVLVSGNPVLEEVLRYLRANTHDPHCADADNPNKHQKIRQVQSSSEVCEEN